MSNRKTFEIDEQCELSFELLYLLKWLTEYELGTLKKIIERAIQNGFRSQLSKSQDELHDQSSMAPIHHSIIDFLDLLDTLLHEAINEHSLKTAYQKNLMPSINKIDGMSYDTAIVQHSLDKTITHLEHNPEANAKELLFKELLKRWKPGSKKAIN